jgi:hypothetical protein
MAMIVFLAREKVTSLCAYLMSFVIVDDRRVQLAVWRHSMTEARKLGRRVL